MDFFDKNEFDEYSQEKIASEHYTALSKDILRKKFENGLGEQMLQDLKYPQKPSLWLKLKIKYARWKKKKEDKKRFKEHIKGLTNYLS